MRNYIRFTKEHVEYVQRYGGMCRNCADELGVCPSTGLPCGNSEKAIKYVLDSISYGINHKFVEHPVKGYCNE